VVDRCARRSIGDRSGAGRTASGCAAISLVVRRSMPIDRLPFSLRDTPAVAALAGLAHFLQKTITTVDTYTGLTFESETVLK